MGTLPKRLAEILGLYGHVEFRDPEKLGASLSGGRIADADEIRRQFEDVLASESIDVGEINRLTAEELETEEEARAWLRDFHERVFK